MFVELLEKKNNLLYAIGHHTETSTSCNESGCNDGFCCRCRTIYNCRVINEPSNWFKLCEQIWEKETPIDDVLASRFVARLFDPDKFEWEKSSGYYGEEMRSITFKDDNFWKKAHTFNQLDTTHRLQMVLNFEYGFVLPDIAAVEEWQLIQVPYSDIVSNIKVNNERFKQYKDHLEYHQRWKLGSQTPEFVELLKLYSPIVMLEAGKYRIIDGHHRFAAQQEKYLYKTHIHKKKKVKKKAPNKDEYKEVDKSYTETTDHVYSPKGVWVISPNQTDVD